MTDEVAKKKVRRQRSPSYPGINLETAISRAQELYNKDRDNWVHINAVVDHWGYSPKSSAGLIAVAALKKFGLIEDRGSGDNREFKLTDLALDIIIEGSPNVSRAIERAALEPTAHKELWDKYGHNIPSDKTLRYSLLREMKFSESAVDDFINEFHSTIEFANLKNSNGSSHQQDDIISDDEQGRSHGEHQEKMQTPLKATTSGKSHQHDPSIREIQLPLIGKSWVTVRGSFPLTEAEWVQMEIMLKAMKPGLVASIDPPEQNDDHEEDSLF